MTLHLTESYSCVAYAENNIMEDAMNDAAMLQCDFSDDSVLIVLDNEKSLLFHEYTVSDFSNIKCKSVTDLTPNTTAMAKSKMDTDSRQGGDVLGAP